jgi:[ribosomal protein S5]-alanine N-acetyltransferase
MDSMRTLHSASLTLEPLVVAHADAMFAALSAPEMYAYMPGKPPASVEALRERYARLESRRSGDGTQQWLNWIVRMRTGECAGFVQATIHPQRTADFAFAFAPQHWGHGVAFEACSTAIPSLFEDFDVAALYCTVDPSNRRSLRLLERLGFQEIAPHRYPHVNAEPGDRVLERPRA